MRFIDDSAASPRRSPVIRATRTATTLSALALATASAACSSGSSSAPATDLARAAQPIFGGQLDRDHPEVMFLFDLAGGGCTGTNIRSADGSGFLLTAAHCVTAPGASGRFLPIDPARLLVVPGADFSQSDIAFPAQSISVEPGWDGSFASDDIAVVRFFFGSEPPPPTLQPLAASEDDLGVDSELLLVGYGATDQGGFNTERRRVARDVADTSDELVAFLQEDGRGACFGDSGGPGLVGVGNDERVALVISGGVQNEDEDACSTGFTLGMRVSAYSAFIESALDD